MSEIYLGNRLTDMDVGQPSQPITRVNLQVDSDTYYTVGDDTGGTMEAYCPWGTEQMARDILAKAQGYIYKPFNGSDALLDPAAELGDAITVGGLYSFLGSMGRSLDRLGAAQISAPGVDEIEDEYPYKSMQQRREDRVLAKTRSLITKTSQEIMLSVEELEGNYTKLSVTLDGVTITDQNGATLIKGSSIDTSTLNVDNIVVGDGAITWSKLGVDVQSEINDAYAMAEDAQLEAMSAAEQIEAWAYNGGTYIDGDRIYSKTIYADKIRLGGDLAVYQTERGASLGGYLGYTESALDGSDGMHLLSANGYGEVVVTDYGAKLVYLDTDNQIYIANDDAGIEVAGTTFLHIYGSSNTAELGGIWDFTGATVKGLTATSVTAVFA